ncbi:hypothetical protein XENOCAPTIV_001022 [Xenoophorus captivus]|uniref:Uncharacterized protein n=1 Tax=Xenoophorus captivus TaxID=1517983 RepID=A0ABV0Q7F1_9TELE
MQDNAETLRTDNRPHVHLLLMAAYGLLFKNGLTLQKVLVTFKEPKLLQENLCVSLSERTGYFLRTYRKFSGTFLELLFTYPNLKGYCFLLFFSLTARRIHQMENVNKP